MASSFTTSFGIEKIATGEQAGVWGTTTNFNIDILDRIASFTSVALSGTTQTLTVREASPGAGTENLQDGMYRVIKFTGALGGNNTVTIAPNTSKAWFIFENATTDSGSSGPYSVILSQGAGANITVQNGKNAIVYCDGAGSGAAVFNALNDLQIATLEVTGAAAVDGLLTAGASVAVTGNVTTTGTVEPAGDTAADDNAAIGYTAGEGLILTGQGSTNDVTIKNDADGEVMGVLTGSTTAAFTGQVTATGFTGTLDGILGSGTAAAVSGTTVTATGKVTAGAKLDMNGTELILDADADTSITADTDNQIDFRIAGADDFRMTANTLSVLSGTTLNIDSGATIANSGTATGFADLTAIADGSAGSPSIANSGDTNTGIYFPAADTVGVATNGAQRLSIADAQSIFSFSIPGAFSANAGGPLALEPLTHTGVGDKMGLSFGQMTSGGSAIDDGTLIYDIKTGAYTTGGGSTHSSDLVFEVLNANAIAERFRISGTGAVYIADSANASMIVGLTINQGAADNEIFALKSSDIAHGMSGQIETDSYCAIQKTSPTAGGVRIVGATETKEGIRIQPMVTTADTTKSTSGESTCVVFGTIKDGSNIDVMDGDANIFGVLGTGGQTKFIVDSDGDIHADGSLSAYDEYDDAMLARAMQIQLSEQPKNEKVYGRIIQTEFDNFVKYNKQTLIDAGLLGKPTEESEKEGHRGLVNVTGMQRLHNGAIVQQRAMFETLKSVVEEMLPGFASKLNERLEAQSLPALPV